MGQGRMGRKGKGPSALWRTSAARPESFQIFSAHRCRQRSPKLSSAPTLHPLILCAADMKISNHSEVPVYTISGSNTARPLPEWLARKRKRSLKQDPEYASRIELLQDFEFEEASSCVRVSEDGNWVMSTGMLMLMRRILVPSKHRADSQPLQAPTNPRYTCITHHTFPCHSRAIQTSSIRRSFCCLPTTPSPYTFKQTVSLNFTPLGDSTTRLVYHGMDAT